MTVHAKRLIKVIKTGQNYLGWDDDMYRGAVIRLTGGKDSAKKCSLDELQKVIDYMHESGFPEKKAPKHKKHGRKPKVAETKQSVLTKIEALLTTAGRPWQYAEAMSNHMFKQPVLEWLTLAQLKSLMIALVIDAKRQAAKGAT